MSSRSTAAHRFFSRLAAFQYRFSLILTIAALGLAAASLPWVKKLGLNSEWTALLPKNKPSVVDLKLAGDRVGGLSTLTVALMSRSKNVAAMQHVAADLVPQLEALKAEGVVSVDWNIAAYQDFVDAHRHLYADYDQLVDIRDALQERLDYEKGKHNPFFVDLGVGPPDGPEKILKEVRDKEAEQKKEMDKFPGGYYLHRDRDFIAIFVRSNVPGGDAALGNRLHSAVNAAAERVLSARAKVEPSDVIVRYGGDLVDAKDEHDAIVQELVIATGVTIVLVLLSIYWLYRRIRSLILLGFALLVPVLVTFAIAQGLVTYLNTSTAFLGSIVIGNGINPMIIWLARFFEERRRGLAVQAALAETHRTSWLATLTASLAAAVAYGSLMITDFRGFRDFGIIGGIGMIMCWLGMLFVLPAMVAMYDKIRPLTKGDAEEKGGGYGKLFWSLLQGHKGKVLAVSVVLGVAGVVLTTIAVIADPLEYDFDNLRSVRKAKSKAAIINYKAGDIVGRAARGMSLAVLANSLDEARWLEKEYEARASRGAPWGDVHSIEDLLPAKQVEKVPLLREIRKLLREIRHYADEKDRKDIDEYMPPEEVKPLGIDALPSEVARLYTERNGRRGTILLLDSRDGRSTWDGRYLVEWSQGIRKVRLPNGRRPPLVGRATIFADMIDVIMHDGPQVMLLSFLMAVAVVLVTFRKLKDLSLAITALVLGVLWMAGGMAIARIKINFLNFVAFPITFGIGVDYGVNILRRIAEEREKPGATMRSAVEASVRETGGAVVLCSLTTIIGYISLLTSANLALNSFGIAMTISEVTCLIAATLTLPAWLLWRSRQTSRQAVGSLNQVASEAE